MIDHLEIRTRRLAEHVRFYADVLAPLGYRLIVDGTAKGFGDGRTLDVFLVEGDPAPDLHYAFGAETREIVDQIYALAENGGYRLDRAPALAPHIHENYYAGYLRDPDGRLVEFVCHAAEGSD